MLIYSVFTWQAAPDAVHPSPDLLLPPASLPGSPGHWHLSLEDPASQSVLPLHTLLYLTIPYLEDHASQSAIPYHTWRILPVSLFYHTIPGGSCQSAWPAGDMKTGGHWLGEGGGWGTGRAAGQTMGLLTPGGHPAP